MSGVDLGTFLAITCCEDDEAAAWFVAQGAGDLNRAVELYFTRGGVAPTQVTAPAQPQTLEEGDAVDVATTGGGSIGAVVLSASGTDASSVAVRLLTPRFDTKRVPRASVLPPSDSTRALVALGAGGVTAPGKSPSSAPPGGDALEAVRRNATIDTLRDVVDRAESGQTSLFAGGAHADDVIFVLCLDRLLQRADAVLSHGGGGAVISGGGSGGGGDDGDDEEAEEDVDHADGDREEVEEEGDGDDDGAVAGGLDGPAPEALTIVSLALQALRALIRVHPQHAPLLQSMGHAVAVCVTIFRSEPIDNRPVAGQTLGDALELLAEASDGSAAAAGAVDAALALAHAPRRALLGGMTAAALTDALRVGVEWWSPTLDEQGRGIATDIIVLAAGALLDASSNLAASELPWLHDTALPLLVVKLLRDSSGASDATRAIDGADDDDLDSDDDLHHHDADVKEASGRNDDDVREMRTLAWQLLASMLVWAAQHIDGNASWRRSDVLGTLLPSGSTSAALIPLGARIHCNHYSDTSPGVACVSHGRYYPGTVVRSNADGTYAIKYDDGDFSPNAPLSAFKDAERLVASLVPKPPPSEKEAAESESGDAPSSAQRREVESAALALMEPCAALVPQLCIVLARGDAMSVASHRAVCAAAASLLDTKSVLENAMQCALEARDVLNAQADGLDQIVRTVLSSSGGDGDAQDGATMARSTLNALHLAVVTVRAMRGVERPAEAVVLAPKPCWAVGDAVCYQTFSGSTIAAVHRSGVSQTVDLDIPGVGLKNGIAAAAITPAQVGGTQRGTKSAVALHMAAQQDAWRWLEQSDPFAGSHSSESQSQTQSGSDGADAKSRATVAWFALRILPALLHLGSAPATSSADAHRVARIARLFLAGLVEIHQVSTALQRAPSFLAERVVPHAATMLRPTRAVPSVLAELQQEGLRFCHALLAALGTDAGVEFQRAGVVGLLTTRTAANAPVRFKCIWEPGVCLRDSQSLKARCEVPEGPRFGAVVVAEAISEDGDWFSVRVGGRVGSKWLPTNIDGDAVFQRVTSSSAASEAVDAILAGCEDAADAVASTRDSELDAIARKLEHGDAAAVAALIALLPRYHEHDGTASVELSAAIEAAALRAWSAETIGDDGGGGGRGGSSKTSQRSAARSALLTEHEFVSHGFTEALRAFIGPSESRLSERVIVVANALSDGSGRADTLIAYLRHSLEQEMDARSNLVVGVGDGLTGGEAAEEADLLDRSMHRLCDQVIIDFVQHKAPSAAAASPAPPAARLRWDSRCGKDIEVFDSGSSATRKAKSGWGTTCSTVVEASCTVVLGVVANESDYCYVGLCSDTFDWTKHSTHCDKLKVAWTYEANGAMHAGGKRPREGNAAPSSFRTGDVIKIAIDIEAQSAQFYRRANEESEFHPVGGHMNDLPRKLRVLTCFGSAEQVIEISSEPMTTRSQITLPVLTQLWQLESYLLSEEPKLLHTEWHAWCEKLVGSKVMLCRRDFGAEARTRSLEAQLPMPKPEDAEGSLASGGWFSCVITEWSREAGVAQVRVADGDASTSAVPLALFHIRVIHRDHASSAAVAVAAATNKATAARASAAAEGNTTAAVDEANDAAAAAADDSDSDDSPYTVIVTCESCIEMGITTSAEAKWVVDAFVAQGRLKHALGDGGHTWPQRGWPGGEAEFMNALCAGFCASGESIVAAGQRRASAVRLCEILGGNDVVARMEATPDAELVDVVQTTAAVGAASSRRGAEQRAHLETLERMLLSEAAGGGGLGRPRPGLEQLQRLLRHAGQGGMPGLESLSGDARLNPPQAGERRAVAPQYCELVGAIPSLTPRGTKLRPIKIGADDDSSRAGASPLDLERGPLLSVAFGFATAEAIAQQQQPPPVLHSDLGRTETIRKTLALMHKHLACPGGDGELVTFEHHLPHRNHTNKLAWSIRLDRQSSESAQMGAGEKAAAMPKAEPLAALEVLDCIARFSVKGGGVHINESAWQSSVLTQLLGRELNDALKVASRTVSTWYVDLIERLTALVPFAARCQLFKHTAFGTTRSVVSLQAEQRQRRGQSPQSASSSFGGHDELRFLRRGARQVVLQEVQGTSSQELPAMILHSERLLCAFAGRRERLRVNLLRLGKEVAAHGEGATRSWFLQLSLALASHWHGGVIEKAQLSNVEEHALLTWEDMDRMDACALRSSLEKTSPQLARVARRLTDVLDSGALDGPALRSILFSSPSSKTGGHSRSTISSSLSDMGVTDTNAKMASVQLAKWAQAVGSKGMMDGGKCGGGLDAEESSNSSSTQMKSKSAASASSSSREDCWTRPWSSPLWIGEGTPTPAGFAIDLPCGVHPFPARKRSSEAIDVSRWFLLSGRLVGAALQEGTTLPIRFSRAFLDAAIVGDNVNYSRAGDRPLWYQLPHAVSMESLHGPAIHALYYCARRAEMLGSDAIAARESVGCSATQFVSASSKSPLQRAGGALALLDEFKAKRARAGAGPDGAGATAVACAAETVEDVVQWYYDVHGGVCPFSGVRFASASVVDAIGLASNLGNWLLRDGIASQVTAFRCGLHEFVAPRALRPFTSSERELLISGDPNIVWTSSLLHRHIRFKVWFVCCINE